jgi:hypothetical protein
MYRNALKFFVCDLKKKYKPILTPHMRVISDGITLFCSAVNKSRLFFIIRQETVAVAEE